MARTGVGIALTQKFYGSFVVDGLPLGGSAAMSGEINIGDIVRSIDGVEFQGLSMDHAASLITGEDGSTVVLSIERFGCLKDVVLTRRPLLGFRGPLFGIGLALDPGPHGAVVREVSSTGAAMECGIFTKGDIVVAVNGQGAAGKTVSELKGCVLGPFGSHVRVSVARASQQPASSATMVDDVEEISLTRGTGGTCKQIRSKEEADELGRCTDAEAERQGGGQCAICCEEFAFDNAECQAIALPCSHIFHTSCIAEWLQRDDSCPTCKSRIPGVMNQDQKPRNGWQAGQERSEWEWMQWDDWRRRRTYYYYDEPICSIQ